MEQYECGKCGHKWTPRQANKPVACPKCKSYKWGETTKEGKQ